MIFTILLRRLLANRTVRISVTALAALLVIMIVSTLGFWVLEKDQNLTFFESFWVSVVTMTTVGYGDLYPKSVAGRIFAMVVTMMGGIGVMAYLVSFLATKVIEREIKLMKGQINVDFEEHILIINCPNEEKVHAIIDELRIDNKSHDVPIVLISDDFETCPDQLMKRKNFYFVRGTPVLARVLENANAHQASQAVLLAKDPKSAQSDGLTTQVALALEGMHRKSGRKLYIVAEAVSRDSIEPLKTAGVDDVVCLETIVPPVLVQAILDPGTPGVIAELSTKLRECQFYVGSLSCMADEKYGKVRECLFRQGHLRMVPVAILRDGKPLVNPEESTMIFDGDKLVYIAEKRQNLDKVFGESGLTPFRIQKL
ncbi:MAG TPA: ion channel [Desulfomonilaceae bacterium]|nr:ion channel [Desulfomonilaceae bacterium]